MRAGLVGPVREQVQMWPVVCFRVLGLSYFYCRLQFGDREEPGPFVQYSRKVRTFRVAIPVQGLGVQCWLHLVVEIVGQAYVMMRQEQGWFDWCVAWWKVRVMDPAKLLEWLKFDCDG